MNLVALLLILLCAGLLGGIMSFFLEQPAQDMPERSSAQTPPKPARPLIPFLVLGVGASFMVPLFLNMISSTLVSEALNASKPEDAAFKLLVIAGFALIAAVSSRRFITTLTDRVIQDVQKAKDAAEEAEKKIDLIVEPEGAPPESAERPTSRASATLDVAALPEDEKRVLRTLFESTFSARALSGIQRDAELEEREVKETLESLVSKALVHQTQTFKGYHKWQLTNAGRLAASAA